MIFELRKTEFYKTRHIFKELNYQVSIYSVIDGTAPGKIWVDDIGEPTCALLSSPEGFFLAGNSNNDGFNQALKSCFWRLFKPKKTR